MRAPHFSSAGWIVAVVLAVLTAWQLAQQAARPTEFHSYYTAARLVAEGQPIARFYDDAWFRAEGARHVPGMNDIYNVNPPTTALAHLPLALLQNPTTARLLWMLLSVAMLAVFIEALVAIAGADSAARPWWYAAVLLSTATRSNLYQGQVYILVGLGLAYAVHAWTSGHPRRAGAALAGLMAYKSAGIMLWPVAVASGKWRMVLTGLAVLLALILVTWPLIGTNGWLAYLHYLGAASAEGSVRATAYQSVEGFIRHLFTSQSQTSFGTPILPLPVVAARCIALGIVALLLACTMVVAFRHPHDELVVGAAVLLTLIAVPLSQAHTFVIAFIAIAQLVKRVGRLASPQALMLCAGAAMIVLPLPYKSHGLYDGWLALFAYPQLYGALLLWLLCILLVGTMDVTKPAAS